MTITEQGLVERATLTADEIEALPYMDYGDFEEVPPEIIAAAATVKVLRTVADWMDKPLRDFQVGIGTSGSDMDSWYKGAMSGIHEAQRRIRNELEAAGIKRSQLD